MISANPLRGEVDCTVGGTPYVLRFNVGALTRIQRRLGLDSLNKLMGRIRVSGDDAGADFELLQAMVWAGLQNRANSDPPDFDAVGDELMPYEIRELGPAIGEAMRLALQGFAPAPEPNGAANDEPHPPQPQSSNGMMS